MLYALVKRNRGGMRGIVFELHFHAGGTTLRGEEGFSAHILFQLVHQELGNFSAILFGHELVTIPAYPYIFELHVRGTDPSKSKRRFPFRANGQPFRQQSSRQELIRFSHFPCIPVLAAPCRAVRRNDFPGRSQLDHLPGRS